MKEVIKMIKIFRSMMNPKPFNSLRISSMDLL